MPSPQERESLIRREEEERRREMMMRAANEMNRSRDGGNLRGPGGRPDDIMRDRVSRLVLLFFAFEKLFWHQTFCLLWS